jgi:hypothetical protein
MAGRILRGRLRVSTVLFGIVFAAALVTYFLVRPIPASVAVPTPTPSLSPSSASPTPSPTPPAPSPVQPSSPTAKPGRDATSSPAATNTYSTDTAGTTTGTP